MNRTLVRVIAAALLCSATFGVTCCSPLRGEVPSSSPTIEADGGAPSTEAPRGVQTERDLDAMMGGMFAVDHIGPDAYNATVTRARAAVGEYLDAYERRLLGSDPTRLASHPLVPLELLRREAPSRTTALARRLLGAWPGREKDLRAQLEILAKGGHIVGSRAVSVRRAGGAESIPNAVLSVEIVNGTTERCTPREVQLWWASGGSALRPIAAVPLEPGARTSVDVSVRGPAATFGDARDVGIDVRADCSPPSSADCHAAQHVKARDVATQ